jgi:tetratricopeptide (TPR) repeat protein
MQDPKGNIVKLLLLVIAVTALILIAMGTIGRTRQRQLEAAQYEARQWAAMPPGGPPDVRKLREEAAKKPTSPEAQKALAMGIVKNGNLEAAIPELEKAIQMNLSDAELHYNLGYALKNLGKSIEALNAFEQAAYYDPQMFKAHMSIGELNFQLRNLDDAIAAYRQAIRLNDTDATAHNNLAAALGISGELDQAIAEYEAAMQLDPESSPTAYNLGVTTRAKGDLRAALEWFKKACELDQRNYRACSEMRAMEKESR